MATTDKYGKPNLAGMPKELGNRIIRTIRETPPPDFEKLHKEALDLEKKIIEEREKYIDYEK